MNAPKLLIGLYFNEIKRKSFTPPFLDQPPFQLSTPFLQKFSKKTFQSILRKSDPHFRKGRSELLIGYKYEVLVWIFQRRAGRDVQLCLTNALLLFSNMDRYLIAIVKTVWLVETLLPNLIKEKNMIMQVSVDINTKTTIRSKIQLYLNSTKFTTR